MSVWIEDSPSGRALCAICDRPIGKGEIRVGGDIGSGKYPRYCHLECFMRRNRDFVEDLLKIVLPRYFGEDVANPLLAKLKKR